MLSAGGAARYASPLGVHDFRKRTQLIATMVGGIEAICTSASSTMSRK